ncbi:hypothetical protein [Sphingomonas jinjuensis]|uniref:hypothetical protein n=1 Tax=Sphingomonas jinjuensis TaxID=535907 RepID=UPI001FEA8F23|nr:hypothetical protein [Sphingomonas jinjuensis]
MTSSEAAATVAAVIASPRVSRRSVSIASPGAASSRMGATQTRPTFVPNRICQSTMGRGQVRPNSPCCIPCHPTTPE